MSSQVMLSDSTFSRTSSGLIFFFFSSRRRHTRCSRDWSSDVCSSDLADVGQGVFRKISHDRLPGFAKVRGLIDEGIAIVHEVKIDADVRGGGIERDRKSVV